MLPTDVDPCIVVSEIPINHNLWSFDVSCSIGLIGATRSCESCYNRGI